MHNGLDCMFDVGLINSSPKHILGSSYNGPRWDLKNKALGDYKGAIQIRLVLGRVCAGRIGRVNANISIQSTISGLEKFQSATNPPKSKFGRLITNFGGFNSAG